MTTWPQYIRQLITRGELTPDAASRMLHKDDITAMRPSPMAQALQRAEEELTHLHNEIAAMRLDRARLEVKLERQTNDLTVLAQRLVERDELIERIQHERAEMRNKCNRRSDCPVGNQFRS
jgi:chromosome segregation ATPase